MKEIDAFLKGATKKETTQKAESPKTKAEDTERYYRAMHNLGREENGWSSLVMFPKKIKSELLQEGESMVLLVRQHPLTLVGPFLLMLLALGAPAVMMMWSGLAALNPLFLMAIWIFWYVAVLGVSLSFAIIWFYNVNILTNKRIISVSFPYILQTKTATTSFSKVEDHSVKANGFWESILSYGTVEIQTAGEQREFAFSKIPHPEEVNALLSELMVGGKESE